MTKRWMTIFIPVKNVELGNLYQNYLEIGDDKKWLFFHIETDILLT